MRIALLAPGSREYSGIADYANSFGHALNGAGIVAISPWGERPLPTTEAEIAPHMATVDWRSFQLVHAELGGGRVGEFLALEWLARHHPDLPLTATVHDPERLIWRPVALPAPLAALSSRSSAAHKASALLVDRWTLKREQQLAAQLKRIVTLTRTGAECLQQRLQLDPGVVVSIPHGNCIVPQVPLPSTDSLKLLYFGFIHRGKGIEDLLAALATIHRRQRLSRPVSLTLAGGTQVQMAFGADQGYLDSLQQRARAIGLDDCQLQWRLDVPADQVPTLIQAHHLLILPYRESKRLSLLGQVRGTSGALSWAAACGRGVIASDARAFAEEVSFGNGSIYPQGHVEALARELLRFVEQPGLVQATADQATLLGQRRAWPLVASRFLQLFDSAMAA